MRVALKQIKEISDGTHAVLTSAEYLNRINKNPAILQTSDAIQRTVNTITSIPDDATTIYRIYVSAFCTGGITYMGTVRTLVVTRVAGTTVLQLENTDVNKADGGLTAVSVVCTVSSNNIAIKVKGVAATTIDWKSEFEKII